MPHSRLFIPITAVISLTWVCPGGAQTPDGSTPAGQDTLSVSSDSLLVKINELEMRLRELEVEFRQKQQQDRLQALRQRAQQRAQERTASPREAQAITFHSFQRQMTALNPELSLSGDFIGWIRSPENIEYDNSGTYPDFFRDSNPVFAKGNRFWLREAEINVVAPLDPYTRGKFFFGIPSDGTIAVEEAYLIWINLPTSLNLKIGYYRNQFGQLNRWHDHALPQVDRPHVLQTFLGGETGLAGLGVSGNWILPRLWAHVNELTLEFISGGDGISFAQEIGRERVAVGRLKNYYDLTPDTYLELGVSGAYGHNDPDGQYETKLGGLDLNYKWVPAGRSKYRTFELRAEAIASWRETPTGTEQSWGAYITAQNKLNARFWTSLRVDYTQLPWDSGHNIKGIAATLDYWQSEFVFFRIQCDHTERTFAVNGDREENRLMLQVVWSMGPHKHEAY